MRAIIGALILLLICGVFLVAMSWVFAPGIVVLSWKATMGIYVMAIIVIMMYWLVRDVK